MTHPDDRQVLEITVVITGHGTHVATVNDTAGVRDTLFSEDMEGLYDQLADHFDSGVTP